MKQVFLELGEGGTSVIDVVDETRVCDVVPLTPLVRVLVNSVSVLETCQLEQYDVVTILPRIRGGKGGFGSMLRAIGAQIEATTNNDACRDLSGKRLRDVKCEKLLKDWSAKQADEKRERKDRKRQRLQKVLDTPSNIRSQDNSYISEMRDMSESVEGAIAAAIAEDKTIRNIDITPATSRGKKWMGEESSSEEEGEEGEEAGSSQTTAVKHEEKSEISVNIIDQEGDEGMTGAPDTVTVSGSNVEVVVDETSSSEVVVGVAPPSKTTSPAHPTPVTEPPIPPVTAADTSLSPTAAGIDTHVPPETDTSVSSPPDDTNKCSTISSIENIEWRNFHSVDEMLTNVSADNLKAILMKLGLKCGGTPLERASRLFSVRSCSPDNMPREQLAGKGKKRKAK